MDFAGRNCLLMNKKTKNSTGRSIFTRDFPLHRTQLQTLRSRLVLKTGNGNIAISSRGVFGLQAALLLEPAFRSCIQ